MRARTLLAILLLAAAGSAGDKVTEPTIFFDGGLTKPLLGPAAVSIRDASAAAAPSAKPRAGWLGRDGDESLTGRSGRGLPPGEWRARWSARHGLGSNPMGLLAFGDRLVAEGAGDWALITSGGEVLATLLRAPGRMALDSQRRELLAGGPSGSIDGRRLADGGRSFATVVYPTLGLELGMVWREGAHLYVVEPELPIMSHEDARVAEITTVGHAQGSGGDFEAVRTLYSRTRPLLCAECGDAVAFATSGRFTILDARTLDPRAVLAGNFVPVSMSLDERGVIHAIVRDEVEEKGVKRPRVALWAVTASGERILSAELPAAFATARPPLVGLDHSVFAVAGDEIVRVAPDPKTWRLGAAIAGAAVLPDGRILAGAGSEVVLLDGDKTTTLVTVAERIRATPVVGDEGDLYVLGDRSIHAFSTK